jgi:hypothetical protein
MNTDFTSTQKQGGSGYYKYNQNQQVGYSSMQQQNQFNIQGGYGNNSNPYSGYLPEQYQNVYYNPYAVYQGTNQNVYPYNYNYQGQVQIPQNQGQTQGFDQNAQYQQMLLNSIGNQQFAQSSDLNNFNQYQNQIGGYMMSGYGYDLNQLNMLQMSQQDVQLSNMNNLSGAENDEFKGLGEEQNEN